MRSLDDERKLLKPGDKVRYRSGKGVVNGVVVTPPVCYNYCEECGQDDDNWCLEVRPEGVTKLGRRRPSLLVFLEEITPLEPFDRTTANVFADWLEENGEPEAAAKLRKAFPIAMDVKS